MVMSFVCILVTLGMAYIWLTRGFFSSLIHFLCVIIAGAIAFASWEPLSYWLLDRAPASGTFSFIGGVAWALGLALPFAASLAILRLAVDKLLPANVILHPKVDYAGGAVCGLLAGLISTGILAMSLGFLRVDSDFLGAQPIKYSAGNGSLVREGGMFFPVDRLTAKLYGSLSERAFRTPDPLARWHPDLHEEGATLRMNYGDGKARNTTRSSDFTVQGRFTVGEGGKARLDELLTDRWGQGGPQSVSDIDGNAFPPGSHIEGFIISFKAGAMEKEGKVAIGAGQIRLVCESTDETERKTFFPVAVSSQADPATPGIARWRYDTRDVYIASVGGGAEAIFAFEFVVPPNFTPLALYVKSVRHEISEPSTATARMKFGSGAERDSAIASGFGVGGAVPGATGGTGAAGPLDVSDATVIENQRGPNAAAPDGIRVSANLPFVIQKGQHGQLELDEENNKNIIISGKLITTVEDIRNQGLDRALQVQNFITSPDTVMVQVDVSANTRTSLLGRSVATAEQVLPPVLVDTNGDRYQPVGYYYQDESKVEVSFEPGQPIQALSQLPSLSRSRPAQRLTLIFRVSFGRSIQYFALGNKVVVRFDPPMLLNQAQGGR